MQVDFYLLQAVAGSREQFACRLAEKAFSLRQAIHLHTINAEQTRMLDELLWTFSDGSFLPHEILSTAESLPYPLITLSHHVTPPENTIILLNLSNEVPDFYQNFTRIIEIINHDETTKQQGRQRFSFYKQQGCKLQHHEI